jgi:3-methyl-2-oxobutanoate hydroxymethyltransferase
MKRKIKTIPDIVQQKDSKPLVMLTAYDYPIARIIDQCDVDLILVGDSVGTTQLGYRNTLLVTLDDMLHHIRAVARAVKHSVIVGDLPFGTYQVTKDDTIRNSIEIIKAGAHAVKIEGAQCASSITHLVKSGIPVMGHVGLTPQSIHAMGGYRIQGRDPKSHSQIIQDARILEESGVFSIVIECVPSSLAKEITETVSVPTIGIGAGSHCNGQVLVINDLLGLDPRFTPMFVKKYLDLHDLISNTVNQFSSDVRSLRFPDDEHAYPDE